MTENERYCVRAGYWHNYTGIGRCEDENLTTNEVCDLINQLNYENELLKKELDYIQNSISEHIKHQKTELEKKALKQIIEDYNEWLLGHKELQE